MPGPGAALETWVGGYRRPGPGLAYPSLLRPEAGTRDQARPWQVVIGLVAGFVAYEALLVALPRWLIGAAWLVAGRPGTWAGYLADAAGYLNPSGMVAFNLTIGLLIPLSVLLVATVHRTGPGWLASVAGRVRWGYLVACLGLAVVVLNAMQVVAWWAAGPLPHLAPQPGFAGWLAVILATVWVQAAGEEAFFRGYLVQALGSLAASPWVGVVASAVLFAFMHGSQDLPLFLNRLAFGLVAGLLVWRTGGLEAGIAGHVVNNVFAYVWAGLTTGIAATRGVSELDWAASVIGVGGYALYAVGAVLLSRLMRQEIRTAAA